MGGCQIFNVMDYLLLVRFVWDFLERTTFLLICECWMMSLTFFLLSHQLFWKKELKSNFSLQRLYLIVLSRQTLAYTSTHPNDGCNESDRRGKEGFSSAT